MASVYVRRKRWWCRLKGHKAPGKWSAKATPFSAAEPREKAQRYADTCQRVIDERAGRPTKIPTLAQYAAKWIQERRDRGVRSVGDDDGRLANHVLPVLGQLALTEIKPRHVRDLMRELKRSDLAPRTVRNVFGVLSSLFHDAVTDEIIAATPCVLKRGELPPIVDKDPEWRAQATYTVGEVRQLVTDPRIPTDRRVQYALKALAGLRHGEAAGLRWRHYEPELEPLGRLVIATSYDTGRTKTDVARRVPVHPTLALILQAWREEHWARIYGRKPEPDDLIVPTRTMRPVDPADANHALKADLDELGLRVAAGKHRHRGGHDLRAWFVTTCQEHGAHRDLLRVVTHTGKGDVVSGYTRATWAALCSEVARLTFVVEKVLPVSDTLVTRERSAGKRWRKVATPTGFENVSGAPSSPNGAATIANDWAAAHRLPEAVTQRVLRLVTRAIEAALAGDEVGARRAYLDVERAMREVTAAQAEAV